MSAQFILFPIQCTISPDINITENEDSQENYHFKKNEASERKKIFKHDRPWIEKNNFNIENNK